MPLARLGHEVIKTTALALVGFALLNMIAARWQIDGLRDALGRGGVRS